MWFSPVKLFFDYSLSSFMIMLFCSFGALYFGQSAKEVIWSMWFISLIGGGVFILYVFLMLFNMLKLGGIILISTLFSMMHFLFYQFFSDFYPITQSIKEYAYCAPMGIYMCFSEYYAFLKAADKSYNKDGLYFYSLIIPFINVAKMGLLSSIIIMLFFFLGKTFDKNSFFVFVFIYICFFIPIRFTKRKNNAISK